MQFFRILRYISRVNTFVYCRFMSFIHYTESLPKPVLNFKDVLKDIIMDL